MIHPSRVFVLIRHDDNHAGCTDGSLGFAFGIVLHIKALVTGRVDCVGMNVQFNNCWMKPFYSTRTC